VVERLT